MATPDLDEIEKDKDQEKLQYNRIYKTYFNENSKETKGEFLFSSVRYEYLDKMPPFQIDVTSKLYEICVDGYEAKGENRENPEADAVLKKLQALLCSKVIPKQVIVEVSVELFCYIFREFFFMHFNPFLNTFTLNNRTILL